MNKSIDEIFSDVNTITKWYEEYPKAEGPSKTSLSEADVLHLKEDGKKYLNAETTPFLLKKYASRDWLNMTLKKGTVADKVAANVIMVSDNPKCNLGRLIYLVSEVHGANHSQCGRVMMLVKELFLTYLLHPKFKLLKFEEQDLNKLDIGNSSSDSTVKTSAARNKLLAHWYFEDQLREQYERFISLLSAAASDTVEITRKKAILTMTDLLIGNAEQEHKLLKLLVNKIGDPSNRIGSTVVFCINKLLHKHPNMKSVVLREVERLLFRKNVAERTQYYALCLLVQFVLDRNDDKIADTLIEVYFAFFKACLKKGEPDGRMMAVVLMGVNRAYPFAKVDSKILSDHIDYIYKVVHDGSFNASLNALNLLYQIVGKNESQADRFYRAFYNKLLDPRIGVTNKRPMFLNLLYRVLRKDQNLFRIRGFIKRILQVSFHFPANMICAILYILDKIIHGCKDLKPMLIGSSKDIKSENSSWDSNDNSSDIKHMDVTKEKREERRKEATVEEQSSIMLSSLIIAASTSKTEPDTNTETDIKIEEQNMKPYDPSHRNPLYAGKTSKDILLELETLSRHYHASVALFASYIRQGRRFNYTGDPLEDLSLIRFLDRFTFKNPKKLESKNVNKKNDPLAQRAGYTPRGVRSIPVNSAAYLKQMEEHIPVDELFLYQYLKRQNESKNRIKIADDEDAESVNSEEFNDMLDRMGDIKDEDSIEDAEAFDAYRDDQYIYQDLAEDDDDAVDDDELQNLSDIEDVDDEDLSDIEFNDSDDEESLDDKLISDLTEKLKKNKEKRKGKGMGDIFMSAEKFSEMLEEESKTKRKLGGSNTFSNIDGANVKQIDWEIERDQKLKGSFNRKRKNVRSSNSKQGKKFKR